MGDIEREHGKGTRWVILRAAIVPPLGEDDLRAALADTAVEVEFVPAPPGGAVEDQRAMTQVRNAVESLRAGSISAMSAWQLVVDAVDRRGGQ